MDTNIFKGENSMGMYLIDKNDKKTKLEQKVCLVGLAGLLTLILTYFPLKREVELSVSTIWQEKTLETELEGLFGQVNYGYDKVHVNIVDDSFGYITSGIYVAKNNRGEVISYYNGSDYVDLRKTWILNGIELGQEYTIEELVTPDGFESDNNVYTFIPLKEDVISEKDYMIVNYVTLHKERKLQIEQEDSFLIDDYLEQIYGDFELYLCDNNQQKSLKKMLYRK